MRDKSRELNGAYHGRHLLVGIFVGQSRVIILEGCQMLLNKLVVYAQFSGLLV